jgi:hypothetical protein
MKERSIIFNDEMVRAILEGRKTQTRRPVKLIKADLNEDAAFLHGGSCELALKHSVQFLSGVAHSWFSCAGYVTLANFACPFGKTGDRLWVRECWQGPLFTGELPADWRDSKYQSPEFCHYRASGDSCEFFDTDDNWQQRWRPSIHMPRWASRINLEITGVRVERLQDISEADTRAEGVEAHDDDGVIYYGAYGRGDARPDMAFQSLWKSIYGTDSWGANPWVWVIEFKQAEDV